jgi:hypothetical protein
MATDLGDHIMRNLGIVVLGAALGGCGYRACVRVAGRLPELYLPAACARGAIYFDPGGDAVRSRR